MTGKHVAVGAVDLFCGVGGLTYGLKRAGVDVFAGYDFDTACEFPYRVNNLAKFRQRDLCKVTGAEIRRELANAHVKVIAGCAPCQPFSTYSRTRSGPDDRWRLLDVFARLTRIVQPDIVAMENVPQLGRHPVFGRFIAALNRQGYKTHWEIANAARLGIPQTRSRLLLLASRHGEIEFRPTGRNPRVVEDVLANLQRLHHGEESKDDSLHRACPLSALNLRRIRASRPGGSWRDWDERLLSACHRRGSGQTYPSVYGRMEWKRPSPTITTQFFGYGNGRFGHPDQDRAISLREGAILQTFPRRYRFEPQGERFATHTLGRMIGNAVPPRLARDIGRSILKHIQELGL